MILGIGHDMVDIRRIERALERRGVRFEARLFTAAERAKAASRAGGGKRAVADVYAKRFAAKEACIKALGGGENISWQEIEVGEGERGRPVLSLHGAAAARLQRMIVKGLRPRLDLSLCGEYPYASAFVVISAEKAF